MNQVEFKLTLNINGKEYSHSVKKEYSDKELLSRRAPQVLFEQLCRMLAEKFIKDEYDKNLDEAFKQINYDRRITGLLFEEYQSKCVDNSDFSSSSS